HQSDREIGKEDLKQIREFIRNNGGIITDSQSVISCVIRSVEKYVAAVGNSTSTLPQKQHYPS
ncbi:MAG: hypothetical protein PHQ43_10800, partial [Dehalococcoidales bacterium]|nr:hypothetical protein [Dehalococcoidales bacterium]